MTLKNKTYSNNQKERGAKEVRLWLTPAAAAAWDRLSAAVPAKEKGKLLSDIVLAYGNSVTAEVGNGVTAEVGNSVTDWNALVDGYLIQTGYSRSTTNRLMRDALTAHFGAYSADRSTDCGRLNNSLSKRISDRTRAGS